MATAAEEIQHLRVLIANEKRERLELLAQVVAGLGHEVIAREILLTSAALAAAALGLGGSLLLTFRARRPLAWKGDRRQGALVAQARL